MPREEQDKLEGSLSREEKELPPLEVSKEMANVAFSNMV